LKEVSSVFVPWLETQSQYWPIQTKAVGGLMKNKW